MANMAKKLRFRDRDPLTKVVKYIEDGELEKVKSLLDTDQATLELFKARLTMDRVSKGYSPLVVAVLNDRFHVFEYIVGNFTVNIEQETLAIIEPGGYPVEGATPLWTASTLGRMEFVKLLVAKGADVEHTTDSESTPLRGAAFNGNCEVCEFLIDNKADIDKPNVVGQSPLTIAAVRNKKECVELLIKKGADVNHKGLNNNTPLHTGVEHYHYGVTEIAEILVKAGARNCPNGLGFTPAILASCYGHEYVLKCLNDTFHLEIKELYNCYCLLAAKGNMRRQHRRTRLWLNKAVQLRSSNPDLFADLPPASDIYDGVQEPANQHDVHNLLQDDTRLLFLSAIFCERILGSVHPTTAFYIRMNADRLLAKDRYKKCVELWQRSLDFDNASRMAYELTITNHLLVDNTTRAFLFTAANDGFIPPVEPHFWWGLKELELASEMKKPDTTIAALISCLFRMIAAWIKLAEGIKERDKQEKEHELISIAVQDMIKAMEGNKCPVLIACLQGLPEHGSGAAKDVLNSKIPLHKAIALFLDHGCSVHCEDEDGNFPLHLVVKLQENTAPDCIRTLLEYGAHFDAVNFDNKTAMDACNCDFITQAKALEVLKPLSFQHLSLQCLCSRALTKHNIEYTKVLPRRLTEFVSWHDAGDPNVIVEEDEGMETET